MSCFDIAAQSRKPVGDYGQAVRLLGAQLSGAFHDGLTLGEQTKKGDKRNLVIL